MGLQLDDGTLLELNADRVHQDSRNARTCSFHNEPQGNVIAKV